MPFRKFSRYLSERADTHPRRIKLFLYFLTGFLMNLILEYSVLFVSLALLTFYLATGGWRFAWVCLLTWRRDLRGLVYLIHVSILLKWYKYTGENIVTLFGKTAIKYPNKTAFVLIDERSWTFKEVDEYSNAISNYFHQQNYQKGDVVAIFMESRPEFVMLWLGLAKIGVTSALINFNLKHEAFAHCINVSGAKSIIFGHELTSVVSESHHLLPTNVKLFVNGPHQKSPLPVQHLDAILQESSTRPPPCTHKTFFNEILLFIYTSGTTGLPKAAVVSHSRYFYMSNSIYHFYKITPHDVIYDTLPLYHTAGGILGVGCGLIHGSTLVIRKKFSASKFWSDCTSYNCTASQYIGEICRYLMVQPSSPNDQSHNVRVMFGNGLRPQIWTQFKERFNIKQIGEFYGATEGNASIVNIDNTPGAIGFQTRIIPSLYPVTLIRVDPVSGEPIRNKFGKCVRCQPGELGELVGKIVKGKALRSFDGYANKEANSKKIAQHVFKRGDSYFLTGDILEMDNLGYMYFRDRTGDTFRWKGENVSTSEVEATISNIVNLIDCTVYGVEIPEAEGKAGMAAIADSNGTLDLVELNHQLQRTLPAYAKPVFIRVVKKLKITGTFKLKKGDYRAEGFDPSNVRDDALYYYNNKTNQYDPLTPSVYQDILNSKIRF